MRMGEDPTTVFVTGCPSIDLAAEVCREPALDFDPFEKYGGVGALDRLSSNGYLVVMQHPVTTEYEQARQQVDETLRTPCRTSDCRRCGSGPTSTPDPTARRRRSASSASSEQPENIHFFKNMSPTDFLRLLYNSRCLVGNSSVGIRECSFLGVPAVNIGSRQDGRERGPNVIDVGYDRRETADAIQRHLSNGRYPQGHAVRRRQRGRSNRRTHCDVAADRPETARLLMRVLGLVPARGGSKGVARKNIRMLCGKPLLGYTAESALAARRLARVVLTTEDEEIADLGRRCGLEVPFMRPAALALDETPMMPVVHHALRVLSESGDTFDAVCLLQPTNPFRRAEDIDGAIELLETTGADSVISFVDVGEKHPARMKYISAEGRVVDPPFAEAFEGQRRQDLPKVYLREGSIYVTRTGVLVQDGSFKGRDCRGWLVPEERACNIDTPFDLFIAEQIVSGKVGVT